MNLTSKLILFFGLGTVIQAVTLVLGSWNWNKFLSSLAWSLLGFIPGRHERDYNLYTHLLFCFVIFAGSIAVKFRKELLPRVNEKILLSYTIVFWYAFFSFSYKPGWLYNCAIVLFLLPTLATMALAVTEKELSFREKLVFYAWYLLMVVFMLIFQFSSNYFTVFFHKNSIIQGTPLEAVLAGMGFCYMMVNITYIYHMFPIGKKHESYEDCMKRWHHWTDLMTGRFDDKNQLTQTQSFLIVLLLGGFLAANYKYNFISAIVAVNMGILVPLFLMPGDVTALAPQPPETNEGDDIA
jgi:hypothetical protein